MICLKSKFENILFKDYIKINILVISDTRSLSDDISIAPSISVSECKICLEELSIQPLSCCSSSICSKCIYHHLLSHIYERRIRIVCPHIFTREEILLLLLLSNDDHDRSITERYKSLYADINRETHIKTCPRCCSIKEIDKSLFEDIRYKKRLSRKVVCNECQLE